MTNICDTRLTGTLKNWFIVSAGNDVFIHGEYDSNTVVSDALLRVDFTQGIAVTKDATYKLSPNKLEGFMAGVV